MKRWTIFGLAVLLLVSFSLPAGAKMIRVARNNSGVLFVIDQVFRKAGDCSVVASLFLMRQLKKTKYGMVKAVARVMKVCCKDQTYQILAYRYLGADRKPLYSRKIPATAAKKYKPKPGTMGYFLVKKVCAPGFPGTGK